jgi:PAS domain S-box-containing protein
VAGEDETIPPREGQAVNHHPETLQPVWQPEETAKTSAVGWVAGCGQPLLRHDIAADKRFAEDEQLVASGIRSAMIIPLRVKGRVTGTWSIGSRQVAAYSPDDLTIAQSVADQLAVVVENTRLYRAVQGYAAELEARVEARTAELGRERERLLAVLESAGDAIVISDSQGNIEYVNPAWERLTGFSAQEVLGQSHRILQSGQTPPEVYDQLWSTVRSGRMWRGDLGDRRRDGSRFEMRATVAPVIGEQGGIVNFVGVFHDVTQLKKLARMKDEFLNTAAHELRTPITSIMGFNELLLTRKNLSDEKRTRYLRHMNDQITHLKRIVDDLLDISQIESCTDFIIGPEPLDLYPLLKQMIRDWQEANPAHTYRLQVSGDDRASCSLARVTGATDGPPRPDAGQAKWDGQGDKELAEAGPVGPVAGWPKVHADKNRVHQVMYNLLSNATKYSPSGSVISVSATSVGGYMEVIVTDEGIGMTKEDLSHIFEKFWRADASSTAIEGTGLGLVIVKHIVEQHGGHIWVESVKGRGTMVHFTLPLVDRQLTILTVEDEDSVREVERRILTRNDIATWVATCGQKAIEIARTCRPDLILLDLTLPDKSGKEVLQALKAHPATAPIPVLVVSARSDWHTVEECYMLGAVDFLTKPFECEELLSRVRRGLKIAAPQIQEMQGSEPGMAMLARGHSGWQQTGDG